MPEEAPPPPEMETSAGKWLRENRSTNIVVSMEDFFARMFMAPARFVRENMVEPFRQKEVAPWYHRRFQRVPTIDECHMDDIPCRTEANLQYFRDRGVEQAITKLLYQRFNDCVLYEYPDHNEEGGVCDKIRAQYDLAMKNWYIKYGDLGMRHRVEDAFMKQKHRMVWERRHGQVGAGMKLKGEEGWGEIPKKPIKGFIGETIDEEEMKKDKHKTWTLNWGH